MLQSVLVPGAIANVAGTHQGDWEFLTVVLSPDGQTIRAMRQSRHSTASGQYYLRPASGPDRDNGWQLDAATGRPVVFSARQSHAVYNVTGVQARGHGGFVDDFCSSGFLWDAAHVVNMGSAARPRVAWARYGGAWGKQAQAAFEGDGPEGPFAKDSFYGVLPAFNDKNCLPPLGPWFADEGAGLRKRIAATGASLVLPKGAPLTDTLAARVETARQYLAGVNAPQRQAAGASAATSVSRAMVLDMPTATATRGPASTPSLRDVSSMFPFTNAPAPWAVAMKH